MSARASKCTVANQKILVQKLEGKESALETSLQKPSQKGNLILVSTLCVDDNN
jgi:hypothetical protein